MTIFDLLAYFGNAAVIVVIFYVGGLTWAVGLKELAVLFFLVAILLAVLVVMELLRFISAKGEEE